MKKFKQIMKAVLVFAVVLMLVGYFIANPKLVIALVCACILVAAYIVELVFG